MTTDHRVIPDPLRAELEAIAAETDAGERRITGRVALALVALSALVALAFLIWTPRLAFSGAGSGESDAATRRGIVHLDVVNQGLVPVRVDGPASLGIPGITATASTGGELGPGARGQLRLDLVANDCAAVPKPGAASGSNPVETPITVRASIWRGDVDLPVTVPLDIERSTASSLCWGE